MDARRCGDGVGGGDEGIVGKSDNRGVTNAKGHI